MARPRARSRPSIAAKTGANALQVGYGRANALKAHPGYARATEMTPAIGNRTLAGRFSKIRMAGEGHANSRRLSPKGRRVSALGAAKIRLSFDKSCRCVAYDTMTTTRQVVDSLTQDKARSVLAGDHGLIGRNPRSTKHAAPIR
jgi:hypothetical protein